MSDYRIVLRATGGPEAMEREAIGSLTAGKGEVVVRHKAIGLNFIDTYHRAGAYPLPLPTGLGSEAAGVIEAVGEGVTDFAPGDRVAYAGAPLGAYATARTMPIASLVKLPDAVDDRTAAAVMLKGMTADFLVGECGGVQAGQHVLVHAAAGGVGSLLVPWLKALGATVIAHVGTAEKVARVEALGADHVLCGGFDALAGEVRAIVPAGVDLVLDSVGKASLPASIACAAKRGLVVSYGNASGAPEAVLPSTLQKAGSVFLTRPTMFDYVDTRERLEAAAARLFARIADGTLKVEIGQSFPLADVAEAHRALEGRKTIGSTVLIP
ncbi:quinone oxidoreductase [Sphingomonas sp. BIUV-7]|uniref:Quinone oxidoreductase n=1 Tax=Sphingomonas natans TaxID=3063330 RepID=A0ABT8YCD8_9SPHN|nr:quinone oxidoreductase [Sphingomonas sp. BIUV-7]MDO6416004.1 quinone oxidoreductase [Sphingomonas sp. BIUV-7]